MNDLQMHMMSLERHQRILAREREKQAAATPPQEQNFAAAIEPAAQPASQPAPATVAEAQPAAEPTRVLTTTAKPAAPPAPQLTADQAALLAASMGATLTEPPANAPPAATATPDMSDDQMAALMAGFGKKTPAPSQPAAADADALPQTAAAMAASAIPVAQDDNLRYFPLNTQAASARQQMNASDTYLRAVQQMERNLGAYGGLTRNGR